MRCLKAVALLLWLPIWPSRSVVAAGRMFCLLEVDLAEVLSYSSRFWLLQIVALQATLEGMATTYPGAFEGYELSVRESHQVSFFFIIYIY